VKQVAKIAKIWQLLKIQCIRYICTMNRRELLQKSLLGIGSLALTKATKATNMVLPFSSPIKHSACRWCYEDIPMDEFCERSLDIGLQSIEMLPPSEWKTLMGYGLKCAVGTDDFITINEGFNNKSNHNRLRKGYQRLIAQAADNGVANLICYSGNRARIDDEKGLENCARGISAIIKEAENAGVTIIMEMLNSTIDHKDYMADNTEWAIELVNKVNSPNFRLLYDIYHMHIMEGNLINTIRQFHSYFAHYHTAGVPGRRELNSSQEINYPAVIKAIVATGYTGYIGHEFIPSYEDKISALEEGIWTCTVESEE